MTGYTIYIQPNAIDASKDHRVDCPFAKEADAFAAWIHSATGAAVQSYDLRTYKVRKTLGDFDESRV